MKFERFVLIPEVEVELTLIELEHLIWLSVHHYDSACRSLSQPGGKLFGMKNYDGVDIEVLC